MQPRLIAASSLAVAAATGMMVGVSTLSGSAQG
jgi:hypothetical protein